MASWRRWGFERGRRAMTAFPVKDGFGQSLHMSEQQFLEALEDPVWRIHSGALYWIIDKNKRPVPFVPNAVQAKFIDEIWYRNVVPKARQRGFSTVVQIMILDASQFVAFTAGVVIAQDDVTAMDILETKFKFAWRRLPPLLHEMVPKKYDNAHEMSFANGSSILAATSSRGQTPSWLHVSEFGIICLRQPAAADEILTGALPSVPETGIVVIESTIESLEGDFVNLVRRAQAVQQLGKPLARQEWRLHFASWHDAAEYEADPATAIVGPQDHQYFDKLESHLGITIGPRKRAWYVLKRDSDFGGSTEKMNRQYPSTLEEAMQASTEGRWLGEQMARVRREGRITRVPHVPGVPVNTVWDIGVDDDVAIWLHQEVGPRDHWIGFIEGSGEPPSHFVGKLQEEASSRGLVWGQHCLPHDAAHRRPGAEQLRTYEDMLKELGLRNTVIVPRIDHLTTGIQQLREDMATYWFDEEACKAGIEHLDGYAKVWNVRVGVWSDQVLKNGHQHAADALRQKAQMASRIGGGGRWKRKRKTSAMAS